MTAADETLETLEDRLERAMAAGNLAWWEMDLPSGAVRFGEKKAEMLGYPPEHFGHYSDFTALLHPEDQDRAMQAMRDHLSGTEPRYNVEYRIRTATGEYRWFHDTGGITDTHPDGSPAVVSGIVADITWISLANRKLNLLASVTRHDINNELTVLQGYLDLARELVEDEEVQDYLGKVDGAAGAILRQVRFTKDYQDLGVREPAWLAISDALARAIPEPALPVTDRTGAVEIYADPLLPKVFSNLMDNTIRHGESATGVRVGYRQENGDLVLIWEDDGVGIPAEHKDRIFDRTFGKNNGLGLFLIREILSITGITITETGTPGEGARFEMRVPAGAWRT
ncbi:MAG: PAS domain-containing sensor histidine kinase [Methanomicrobiales archaeon]